MKGKILLLISTLCFVMFVGCATSIPVNIQRPSALDLGDAETVCVVPFKLHEFDDNIKFSGFIINFGSIVSSEKERKEEVLVSTYITKQLTSKLVNSDCYKLVDSAVVEAAINEFGRIDVLINNAQASASGVTLANHTVDQFNLALYSGLYATFHYMKACYPYLKETKGSVINFASGAGLFGNFGQSAYAAGHIGGFTRCRSPLAGYPCHRPVSGSDPEPCGG